MFVAIFVFVILSVCGSSIRLISGSPGGGGGGGGGGGHGGRIG